MVSDDDVWDFVRRKRKERRKQLRRENGPVHRFVKVLLGRRLCRFTELSDEQSLNDQDTMPMPQDSPISGTGSSDIEIGRLDSRSTESEGETQSDTSTET